MECHSTYIEYIVFYTYLMELKDIGLNLAKARMQANIRLMSLAYGLVVILLISIKSSAEKSISV